MPDRRTNLRADYYYIVTYSWCNLKSYFWKFLEFVKRTHIVAKPKRIQRGNLDGAPIWLALFWDCSLQEYIIHDSEIDFFFRLRCKRMRYTRILDASLHFLFVGLSVGSSVRLSATRFFSRMLKNAFSTSIGEGKATGGGRWWCGAWRVGWGKGWQRGGRRIWGLA